MWIYHEYYALSQFKINVKKTNADPINGFIINTIFDIDYDLNIKKRNKKIPR